jgi:imidazoleglycerol phosphate dehydratase HisB
MTRRTATFERTTKETSIRGRLDLDGDRHIEIETGIGFLDHLLTALAFHAYWDLELSCEGDLVVDDHHTAEDCAIVLGQAVRSAVGGAPVRRFGHAYAPLDEALARAVVDLSGRPWPEIDLGLEREMLGGLACENVGHVLRSFALELRAALHVDVLKGANDHHRAEAAFKAVALALRQAVAPTDGTIPSTKGTLDSGELTR